MLWFDKHRQDKRMSDGRAKVVIVGAGFGGMEAAKSLSRAPVEVTVNRKSGIRRTASDHVRTLSHEEICL